MSGLLTSLGSVFAAASSPVSIVNLTSGTDTDGNTTATTASVSPGTNRLLLLTVASRMGISVDPDAPTVSGCGLTWVQVATALYDNTSASRRRVSLFRALGTPSAGALTIDFAAQSQSDVTWILDEASNVNTGGTNGSGAVAQSATNADTAGSTTITVTLAAFSSANNATYAGFGKSGNYASTAGSGFGNKIDAETVDVGCTVEFRSDNDTTADITYDTAAMLGGIAIEIVRL